MNLSTTTTTPTSDYDYSEYYDGDYEKNSMTTPFCGDPLWMESKFGRWSPAIPLLTWCLQHAVLAEIPVVFFFIMLPALCMQIARAKREHRLSAKLLQDDFGSSPSVKRSGKAPLPYDTLANMCYLFTAFMMADKMFILLRSCYELWWEEEQVPIVEFVYPTAQLITLTALLWAEEHCRLVGLVSPGIIFCTWLLFFLTGIPEFYVWIRLGSSPNTVEQLDFYRYLAYLIYFPICSLQLVLHFFSTAGSLRFVDEDGKRHRSPESLASFPSRQFFSWFTPMVQLGRERALKEVDVFEMENEMKSQRLYNRWMMEWRKRIRDYTNAKKRRRVRIDSTTTTSSSMMDHRYHVHYGMHEDGVQVGGEEQSLLKAEEVLSDRAPLIESKTERDGKKKKQQAYGSIKDTRGSVGEEKKGSEEAGMPSVVGTLFSLFKRDLLGAAGIRLISDLLTFVNPLVLNELIGFVELTNNTNQLWYGFVLAATLFVASELRSLIFSTTSMMMYRISVQVQSLLTSAVYAKTLRLSSGARRVRSTGEIANLLAIDVERFQALIPLIQQYWSSPLQVVISLYLLYGIIGWAVVGGVAVMLMLVPANFIVSVYVKRWQVKQMQLKDERLKMTNEVLSGIRVVKLYAWEPPMMRIIESIRSREVHLIKKAALVRTCIDALNISSPFLVSIVTFAIYTLSDPANHLLTPQVAFVSISLFSLLRMPMIMVAEMVSMTVQAMVSGRRLRSFLMEEEVDETVVERDMDPDYERSIDVEFASFNWPRSGGNTDVHKGTVRYPFTLNDIQLHVKRGILITIVGQVGAGKSSLLSALIGDMPKIYGYVGVRGRLAYCPQQSWIQNRTLRANITLSLDIDEEGGELEAHKFNEELYNQVLEACDLRKDLAQLPKGDMTLIGERGINLSGGQKARVSLARALYQQADIYLLDDPLSAVDAIVGRHLFDRAIGPKSAICQATRLLVSHSLAFVAESDLIVVLEEKRVKRIGTYKELIADAEIRHLITRLEKTGGIYEQMNSHSIHSTDSQATPLTPVEEQRQTYNNDPGNKADLESESSNRTDGTAPSSVRSRKKSRASSRALSPPKPIGAGPLTTMGKGDASSGEEEMAAIGRVSFSVYKDYFRATGWAFFWSFIVFIVANTVANTLNSFWLSNWSDDNSFTANASSTGQLPLASEPLPLSFRLSIYTLIGLVGVVLFCLANVSLIVGGVNASIHLHHPLLLNLLRSRISFFDITPLGRMLNRFGKEMDTVDLRLSSAFRFLAVAFLTMAQVFAIVAISTPLFILLAVPMGVIYTLILRYFIPTSRQLQRLNSIARSPLYTKFAETIQGVTSIRAYGMEERFFREFRVKVDSFSACKYYSLVASRWLSIRLELIGNLIILASATLAVLAQSDWLDSIGLGMGTVTAGLVGLSVSKSLDITYMLSFLVRQINEVETSVVSVERIREYSDISQQEAAWTGPIPPPKEWPSRGSISIKNLTCQYRVGLSPCLNRLNVDIKAGERIGVVGRTGAGKTSLTWALLRMIEPTEGRILIDQVDISTVGLHELRLKCTVIPQDPVLFSGSLRFNLDPFEEKSDRELWTALEHAHLKEFVMARAGALHHPIAEMGENVSVGQRQLICLARAILRRSPIIICDEATASVDQRTDALIQRTIREEFGRGHSGGGGGVGGRGATVITIAHRLSTIMDYDRVMVMEEGRLVEFDTPDNLVADKKSMFHALVSSMNEEK